MGAAGVAVIGALCVWQSMPEPWWLWALLGSTYVLLDLTAVEVNDRLRISSAAMVAFAAAVVFGRDAGVLAVAVMSVGAAVQPADLRIRRWQVPAANLGILVVSTTAAMIVFRPFLPAGPVDTPDLPGIAAGAVLAALAFDWIGFRLVSFMTRRIYRGRNLRPWSSLLPNHVALTVLAAFGALLGAAYLIVGPVLLPLMGATFAVGQTAFRSYGRLRDAHLATISGFVKAIEALDRHTKGHTERVARFCEMAATRIGLEADDLERVRWAALLHDVGKVAVPAGLLSLAMPLDAEERERALRRLQVVDDVLSQVEFLAPIVRIVADSRETSDRHPDRLEARILAAADLFDTLTAARSYRESVTQQEAFAELRRRAPWIGSDAVEALIGAIQERGEVYGHPDAASVAEAERLVKERAIRA